VADEALAMSAELGFHGGKDIAKVMAIVRAGRAKYHLRYYI
jgi:hypothetical protein